MEKCIGFSKKEEVYPQRVSYAKQNIQEAKEYIGKVKEIIHGLTKIVID